jgi:hypothetical protein
MRTACIIALVAVLSIATVAGAGVKRGKTNMSGTEKVGFALENEFAKYVVAGDGLNLHFVDKASGKDYCDGKSKTRFAQVKKAGKVYDCSHVSFASGKITVDFDGAGARAIIKAEAKKHYFVMEVLSVTGEGVEEMTFADVALTLKGDPSEPFGCCAMALNLKTNSPEIPGMNNRLRAICYPRFGFAGASVAIVGCPMGELRRTMQEVVTNAPQLPHAALGGPWALDAKIARGSYLFNFDGVSETNVDQWIAVAKDMGMTQIDFHGGGSFRFGDCRPNPATYPNGRASLKAVIDKLHAAGIKAGLHTYAFFMDKSCPWVTPKPDPRLGRDATFTLAEDLPANASVAPVVESTEKMSTVTGFFERNSVTLMVDEELITYSGISKTPPYSFTGCTRGAYGTTASAHTKGAKAHHLTECFGYFAPEGDSTLLAEVAAASADMYNECGFDMMYLDALDGEDVLGGAENGWHYGSEYVFELFNRLKKPPLMEMSTFHHHLWYVRSRIGAMDTASRSQKRFIDIHCHGLPGHIHAVGNKNSVRMFLPAELGWWTLHTAGNIQVERTFPDDIEYLMCRCMATNTGFALMGINPDTIKSVPAFARLAPIFKNYEDLRHAGYFPESVTKKLDKPGAEFTLDKDAKGKWQLYPIEYAKHKVTSADSSWTVDNKLGKQPVRLRIEALMSAGPYDSPEAVTVADFAKPDAFADRSSEKEVSADLKASSEQVKSGVSGCLTALSTRAKRDGSWAKIGKTLDPPLNLGDKQALGVWVYGDGKGELLNIQIRSPKYLAWGIGDHYVNVDFTGWRYFELIEPEGGHTQDYTWPYGDDIYGIYREYVNYASVGSISLWYNNLPKGEQAQCYLSPIRALPLVKAKLRNPKVTINGQTITFPVELESGCYMEFVSKSDCKVYGPAGEMITEVAPQGDVPTLEAGENRVELTCEGAPGVSARANVTVVSRSKQPLR